MMKPNLKISITNHTNNDKNNLKFKLFSQDQKKKKKEIIQV